MAPKRDNTQTEWLSSVKTVALKRENTQCRLYQCREVLREHPENVEEG